MNVLRRKIVYLFGEFHPLRFFVSFLHNTDSKNGSHFCKSTKLHYSCIIYLCSRICLTNSASSAIRWEPYRLQNARTQPKIGIFIAPQSLKKWVSFCICLYAPQQWMQPRRDNEEQIWHFRNMVVSFTVGCSFLTNWHGEFLPAFRNWINVMRRNESVILTHSHVTL